MSAGFRCVCGSRHGCSEAHITHRQSFHPPTSLRDFYRYIRIDFLSHYGNEFYCPVSLLRVYGLTHLEEWKWETWEAESRAKHEGSVKADVQNLASVSADSIAEHTSSPEVLVE